jgi:hypothetical protein
MADLYGFLSRVMCPHPDNLHCFGVIKDLVDQSMLYVDASGVSAGKISPQPLVWRRIPVRIFTKDIKQVRGCGFEA